MRPLGAILVWVAILGGLALYMKLRPEPGRLITVGLSEASGAFSLEVVLTFDAGPDPFATEIEIENRPSLVITFEGEEWLRRTDKIPSGTVIVIDDITGIKSGLNELYLSASPIDEEYDLVRGVRVRLMRDEVVVAEDAFWSEPGHLVEGPMRFDIPKAAVIDNSPTH